MRKNNFILTALFLFTACSTTVDHSPTFRTFSSHKKIQVNEVVMTLHNRIARVTELRGNETAQEALVENLGWYNIRDLTPESNECVKNVCTGEFVNVNQTEKMFVVHIFVDGRVYLNHNKNFKVERIENLN